MQIMFHELVNQLRMTNWHIVIVTDTGYELAKAPLDNTANLVQLIKAFMRQWLIRQNPFAEPDTFTVFERVLANER